MEHVHQIYATPKTGDKFCMRERKLTLTYGKDKLSARIYQRGMSEELGDGHLKGHTLS